MTYYAGFAGEPPRIICNAVGCNEGIRIEGLPPQWFIDGRAKRGWEVVRSGHVRTDYCPRHTAKARAEEAKLREMEGK